MISLPRVSGIYCITCLPTKKVYIGSSTNVRRRCRRHEAMLRSTSHHNIKLQRAWKKYGAESFTLVLLEVTPRNKLLEREEFWFEQYQSYVPSKGFNFSPFPNAPAQGRKLPLSTRKKMSRNNAGAGNPNYRNKPLLVCSFCGVKFRPKGRSSYQKYCSLLCYSHAPKSVEHRYKMGNATRGKKRSQISLDKHFQSRAGRFLIIEPDGKEYEIKGLAKFCREHELDQGMMSRVAAGRCRQYKGWKCRKLQ